MEDKMDFYGACEELGIHIYNGIVLELCSTDIGLIDIEDFLGYCTLNGIKAIFLQYEFKEEEKEPLDIEEFKTQLKNYYNNLLKRWPYSEQWLPKHITQEFFKPALIKTFEEIEQDRSFDTEQRENNDAEEPIEIKVWALHAGCRIFATVYEKEDDDNERTLSGKDLLEHYAKKLVCRLEGLKAEAELESDRIEKEIKERTIKEITEIIENNNDLITMNTQRSRYEFADRIQICYQEEKGCDWLTKKQVRSMVEYRYLKLTE